MDSFEFYYNLDVYNKNSLKHSGESSLKGQQRENVKYYKREGTPGHYKYYYTKEEYEASKKPENKVDVVTNVKPTLQANKTFNKKKKVSHKSLYTPMQQAKKINNAKMNKQYDKKFVDVVQGKDKMTSEERVEEYKNYLQDPENYDEDTYIENRLTKLSEGGNVNLNLRPEISTNELLNAKWGDIDPELESDGYATVYSATYCNEKEDTYGNFTPIIMNPETGEYIRCMDPQEFQEYCEDVMDGRKEDEYNCQIGSWFTGEGAADRAEKATIEIHNLHEQQHVNEENKKKNKSK